MTRARSHFGAEKVVTGVVPHARPELNITPLIDVLLVLIVIFMAALPLTQKGLDVSLPSRTVEGTPTSETTFIVLDYSEGGTISINHEAVTLAGLEPRLRNIFMQRRDKTMFLIGAGALRYKNIVDVLDAAKGAGVEKVGIVTTRMRVAGGAAS